MDMDVVFGSLARKVDLSLMDYMSLTSGQAEIESCLGQFLNRYSTVIIGAFSRKTLISPLSGNVIELLVLFNEERKGDFFPRELMEKLAVTFEAHFDGVQFSKQEMTLSVPFDRFRFDVRPGFLIGTGTYLVPSKDFLRWDEYATQAQYDEFLAENGKVSGRLRHLVQLVKTWNVEHGKVFDEYYLELLVLRVMKGVDIGSYTRALRFFFYYATREVVYKLEDPADRTRMVEGLYNVEKLFYAMKLFYDAAQISMQAVDDAESISAGQATELWTQLFPQSMPEVIGLRTEEQVATA